MIAVLLVLAAAVSLAVAFFASVGVLGWVALGLAVAAVVLLLVPTALVGPVETPASQEAPSDVETVGTPAPAAPVATPAPVGTAVLTDDLVRVVPGRRRYHRAGCALLADHDVEKLTEEEAREEEFTPCTRCVT